MSTWIRFEAGKEDQMSQDFGPFDFIQATYGSVYGEQNGQRVEIASYECGDWILAKHFGNEHEQVRHWTDFVISDKEPGQAAGAEKQVALAFLPGQLSALLVATGRTRKAIQIVALWQSSDEDEHWRFWQEVLDKLKALSRRETK